MSGPKREDRKDWENDPVWNLLDNAERPEPGPFFVRNVMREVRLAETAAPWWKRLLSPKPLAAGALAVTAAVAILIAINPGSGTEDPLAGTDPVAAPADSMAQFEDAFNEELLIAASEDPSAFSMEELVALVSY